MKEVSWNEKCRLGGGENQLQINGKLCFSLSSSLTLHYTFYFSLLVETFILPQNQLLALDKENNTIQTTIHTNILVDSFYNTTSHGSNNNLLNDMNEFTTNNVQSLTSPVRENLLIDDGSECTDECNQNSCNCINNEGGNNNEDYGKERENRLTHDLKFLELSSSSCCFALLSYNRLWQKCFQVITTNDA